MRRPTLVLLLAAVALMSSITYTPRDPSLSAAPTTYLETFDGSPSRPRPWRRPDFRVDISSNDPATWGTLHTMQGQHGPGCDAPPATHQTHTDEGAVFQCRDHLMTALAAIDGYAMAYLVPP